MHRPGKSDQLGAPDNVVLAPNTHAPTHATWATRLTWLLLPVLGGGAFGEALSGHSRPVQLTGTTLAWVAWAAVALALLVPSTVSLTIVRAIVPAALVSSMVASFNGASVMPAAVAVSLSALAAVGVMHGDLGEHFAQASAYGDERRLVLRPPLAFLVPAVIAWFVLCAAWLVGPLTLAARGWVVGVPLTIIAVLLSWYFGRRFHRLSRRWLVLVPAGVVIHDHLVLAETVMFQRSAVSSITLALADTEAADLTGPAAGHAIEIALADLSTIVLAPTREKPNGTALHVRSMLVAPTRPGRALAAAAQRRLPVG